jgi:hypothetical protein
MAFHESGGLRRVHGVAREALPKETGEQQIGQGFRAVPGMELESDALPFLSRNVGLDYSRLYHA